MFEKRQDIVICRARFYKDEPFYLVMFDNLNNTKKFITFLSRRKDPTKNIPFVKENFEDLLSVDLENPVTYLDTINTTIKDAYSEEKCILNIYFIDVENNEALRKKVFSLGGKLFFWVRQPELECDNDFIAYNKDVFDFFYDFLTKEQANHREIVLPLDTASDDETTSNKAS